MRAREFVDGGFDACFFAGSAFKTGGFEVVALGETEVHALEHAGPVHGFGTTDAGGDAEDGIVAVVGAGEAEGFLEGLEGVLEGGELGVELGGEVALVEREQFTEVVELGFEEDPRLGLGGLVG